MRKSITLLTLFAGLSLAFGQGQVNFLNNGTQLTSTNIVNGGPATGLSGTAIPMYYYAIFWAPSTQFNPAAFTWFGNYGTNQGVGGRFFGGSGTARAPAIAGQAIGTTVNIIIRGWSANFTAVAPPAGPYASDNGAAWNDVWATVITIDPVYGWPARGAGLAHDQDFWYGESGIATVVLGGGATPIQSPFGTTSGFIQNGITLNHYYIPEPGTLALVGLGAATLLLFRRKPRRL